MATRLPQELHYDFLDPFQNVAGHAGIMSNADGEIVVKPCTHAEIDFYQETAVQHSDFAEVIPAFLGTLTLGDTTTAIASQSGQVAGIAAEHLPAASTSNAGKPIASETAIVLENLEHGFTHPSVIDLKLGSRLYAPGTAVDKAARLDKVASETTSGSLNFRIAGMKVWNQDRQSYDVYDKLYGRTFNAESVIEGFETFFKVLSNGRLCADQASQILAAIISEVEQIRQLLESKESRFYSASILIVCEGDADMLATVLEQYKSEAKDKSHGHESSDVESDDEDDEDEEDNSPKLFSVRVIDFAHSAWCPGQGRDENIIIGIRNIETKLGILLEKLVSSSREKEAPV